MNNSSLKTPFFIVLFIFAGIFLYTKLAGPIPFSVNSITTTKSDLFQATGTGKETAVPNTAEISLGVTQNSPTVEEGKTKADKIVNKLTQDLKNIGIDAKDIQTTNYSVNQGFETDKSGYIITQNIVVKVTPIGKANQAIDIATKDGANQIGGVNFVLDDKTRQMLENKARIKAVQNAKQKAQGLANAAGIKLGRIADIQETDNGITPLEKTSIGVATGAPDRTNLNPGETTVEKTVTISFETF